MGIFRLSAIGIWLAAALPGAAAAQDETGASEAGPEIVVGLLSIGAGLAPAIYARLEAAPAVAEPPAAVRASAAPAKRGATHARKTRSTVARREKRAADGLPDDGNAMNFIARALDQDRLYTNDTRTADAKPVQFLGF